MWLLWVIAKCHCDSLQYTDILTYKQNFCYKFRIILTANNAQWMHGIWNRNADRNTSKLYCKALINHITPRCIHTLHRKILYHVGRDNIARKYKIAGHHRCAVISGNCEFRAHLLLKSYTFVDATWSIIFCVHCKIKMLSANAMALYSEVGLP